MTLDADELEATARAETGLDDFGDGGHREGLERLVASMNEEGDLTETGENFRAINPKGYVPAIALKDGSLLTEAAAIIQYLADQQPGAGLAPANGTTERYRLIEWLTFISSEIHKGFGPLWNPTTPEAVKAAAKDRLAGRFAYLDEILAKQPFLTGETFTIALRQQIIELGLSQDAAQRGLRQL